MEQHQASPMYKPCLQQQETTPGLGGSDSTVEDPMTTDQCHDTRDLEDSQLVGVPVTLARDVDMAERDDGCCLPNLEAKMEVTVVGKRKRGRPARALPKTPPPLRKKRDEEDVCFICFDGGSLVLCDRRGCPKAYHPACIKRDESFFRSKAKWNCGWHICSICRKASHYMCYTCTFSLCKGCTKDADFVCVRGNKGLCGLCMRTIILIENSAQGNKAMCEVDFDDKSSWEYLFKVYWMYLKGKLSLTLDELLQAKNPWKGTVPMTCKAEAPHELHLKDDKGSGSENSCIDIESNNLKNTKYSRQPELPNKEDCYDRTTSGGNNCVSLPECTNWGSKELLEFVAHMKNGDTSLLSQFDVQALLLEYVKKNNLRDPEQKCQIVCDSRLLNLFGKARVGHFEMLKLLESHFLIKDNDPSEKTFGAGIIDAVVNLGEASDNYDNQLMLVKEKRRKTFRKDDVQVPQNNPDAYAAITSHNINLIYLRRSLMENLTDDAEKIHEKVVGSFVRIRISSSEQKHEMHRLVQVIGTSKVAEPYKIGTRTTDIVLEILNLNRKEVISIDEISNQEFSEDECKRLRQSIKYGLSKRLTVGEILDKALSLQEMRVNDLLEAEILRLSHLRDRASEKGHKKELRECVEKLQILSSPEERQRRLHEIPEVHSDPNLDLMFESDEDAGDSDERKQDDNVGSKYSGVDRRERGLIFPKSWDGVLNDVGYRTQDLPTTRETIGNACIVKNQINPNNAAVNDSTNVGVVRSEVSDVAMDISSLLLSTVMDQSNDFVNDKLWHYRDPSGKIQGPFSLLLLCKWNASGHFPSDLRIWRINEKEDDSILLTDIPSRKCSKMSLGKAVENKPPASSNVPVQEVVPSWSTASSLVNGGTPLPEVTVEWRRCSPEAPPNPSVEEWDSNVVSASSLKPVETVGDCAATPSSISCQLTHSSPSHPACNTSTWQAIIGEANDLVDESVSDLLAEVEAMESLGGLESPTSIMNCGEELTEGSKTDCLSSAEGLSPMLDAGKGDALSSTGDLHLPSHSSAPEEPLRQADVSHHRHQRICGEHSSRSSEVEVGTKNSRVSGNHWESCSEDPPIVSSSGTWDMSAGTTWRLGSGTTSDWQSSQVNANLGWDGMDQRTSNMGWGLGRTTMQENRSTDSDTSAGTLGFAGSQTRYVSDRFSMPRDRGFHGHGRESGFGRGRTVWNRQPSFGVGNGGSYRPLPKGQRVCKFYESGYCKKGAYCDYLHP